MIQWIHDQQCSVALDLGHAPVLISTWYGRPSCGLFDRYFSWSDTHAAGVLAAEQQVVHIIGGQGARMPAAAGSKRLLEHARDNLAAELRVGTILVSEHPGLRAIARAAAGLSQWGRGGEIIVVESIDAAIEEALRCLKEARIPAPVGLAPGCYRAPTLDLVG